ncbi:hypothetical protein L7F22_032024 [Adiantum nelumboides]|nr:hypothetical protein [Adiantum nelumboides]
MLGEFIWCFHCHCKCAFPQQEFVWLQENVAGSSSGTQLVKVKFVLEKRCEFGQHFNVVGDDELFGAWNPEASIPMQWSEGHIWTTEMEVFAGKRVEFKVILVGGESGVDWQPGPNRVLETSEASTFPVVLEIHWGEYDSFQNCSMPSSETAEIESITASTAFEQFSSDSVINLDELDFLASDDKSENTTVDGHSVEMLTEVSKGLAAEDANKDSKKKLTVLERDLQWGREALSMLFGAFRQKGHKQ